MILRIELGFTHQQVAEAMGKPTANAARMCVTRALVRLAGPTPNSVSGSLEALLNDPSAMFGMGRKLQEYVSERYLWGIQAQRHLRVFPEMTGQSVS